MKSYFCVSLAAYRMRTSVSTICELLSLGFEERTRGSHHVFQCKGVMELLNLQRDGSKAKPYQVKQARAVIVKYRLAGEP